LCRAAQSFLNELNKIKAWERHPNPKYSKKINQMVRILPIWLGLTQNRFYKQMCVSPIGMRKKLAMADK